MHSISLTYDQAAAIGQLARDSHANTIDVTNPNGLGCSTVFASMDCEDGSLVQHAIDLNGHVATMATVAA